MLAAYQAQLQALIQAPNSPSPLVPAASQTSYINIARAQLAADAECIRVTGALALVAATQAYAFSAIVLPGAQGYGSVIAVRSGIVAGVGKLEIRPWEWFQAYYSEVSGAGLPRIAAQQGQGVNGTLQFWPQPAAPGSVNIDCVVLPIDLADDTTVEAVPRLWRDAVPFYAAWLAMQSLQRQADAEAMLKRYMMLAQRGRQLATPTELPDYLPGGVGARGAASRSTLAQPQGR